MTWLREFHAIRQWNSIPYDTFGRVFRQIDVAPILAAVRSHWDVKNGLHWVLDIAFREDDQHVRIGNSPQNFAVLLHVVLNLLTHETSLKVEIKVKRKRAG